MRSKVSLVARMASDFSDLNKLANYSDPSHMVGKDLNFIDVSRANPFLASFDFEMQTLGLVDNRICGSVSHLPKQIRADGVVYETSANPNIFVVPDARKFGVALDLFDRCCLVSRDHISLDFYVSRPARRVANMMGYSVFQILRFVIIRKSVALIGSRLPRAVACLLGPLLDVVFAVHRAVVGLLVAMKTSRIQFCLADDDVSISEFVDMIARDSHRFRENVTCESVKWILKYDYFPMAKANKHLWRVVKGGQTLGFVLARENFLGGPTGRIIDWQFKDEFVAATPWILLKMGLKLVRKINFVVIAMSAGDHACSVMKKLLPRKPVQAATVGVGENSPLEKHEGWRVQANWRIRPTMGDSCLY